MDISLCLIHAYCTVGSNGNVKKKKKKKTDRNLPMHFKPVLFSELSNTKKQILPEAGLK